MSENKVTHVSGRFTATVEEWSSGFKKVVNLRADNKAGAIIFHPEDVPDLKKIVEKLEEK